MIKMIEVKILETRMEMIRTATVATAAMAKMVSRRKMPINNKGHK